MVHLGFLSLFIISYLRKVKQKHPVAHTPRTRLYCSTDNTDVTKIQEDTIHCWVICHYASQSVTLNMKIEDGAEL